MYPGTPRCTNLSKRPECLTLSKALDASRKHINKPPFKFLYLSTISFKTYIQVSVPSDCLKPNWLWQVSSNPDILNNRILSTTLDITLATMYHGEQYCTHTWVTPLHGGNYNTWVQFSSKCCLEDNNFSSNSKIPIPILEVWLSSVNATICCLVVNGFNFEPWHLL